MTMTVQAYVIVGALNPISPLPAAFVGVSVIRRVIPADPATYTLSAALVQPIDPTLPGLQGLNIDLAKNAIGDPLVFVDYSSAINWLSAPSEGDQWRRTVSAHAIVSVTVALP